MKHTILVAEDEPGIRDAIAIYLRAEGYDVVEAENGKQGLESIDANDIHLAIVDVMMPVMDGLSMIKAMRQKTDIPVIILSAKSEEVDKINGFSMGADDYLAKPFSSLELLARVKARLNRYEQILQYKNGPKEDKDVVRNGGLELNSVTKEVKVDGKPIHLTPKEFQILELLMRNPERVFSAAEIYESIWKEDAISTETITVHIRKLREKIEKNPRKPLYIQVVWGLGYKMRRDGAQ